MRMSAYTHRVLYSVYTVISFIIVAVYIHVIMVPGIFDYICVNIGPGPIQKYLI
jgi:hypothetical protein